MENESEVPSRPKTKRHKQKERRSWRKKDRSARRRLTAVGVMQTTLDHLNKGKWAEKVVDSLHRRHYPA
ncbi:MAG: hypothetical protein V4697_02325 [Patescibacteria group bacterium]